MRSVDRFGAVAFGAFLAVVGIAVTACDGNSDEVAAGEVEGTEPNGYIDDDLAFVGAQIPHQSMVTTDTSGRVKFNLAGGGLYCELLPGSEVEVGRRGGQWLRYRAGTAYCTASPPDGDPVELQAGETDIRVGQAKFGVTVDADEVVVRNTAGSVEVGSVALGEGEQLPVDDEPSPDEIEQWVETDLPADEREAIHSVEERAEALGTWSTPAPGDPSDEAETPAEDEATPQPGDPEAEDGDEEADDPDGDAEVDDGAGRAADPDGPVTDGRGRGADRR